MSLQVSEAGQRVSESQVAHVENEIEIRAANIVSALSIVYALCNFHVLCWLYAGT